MSRASNYDKQPFVEVPDGNGSAWQGWDAVAAQIRESIEPNALVVIDCYSGVFIDEIVEQLQSRLLEAQWINASQAMLSPTAIDHLIAPDLGGDDPVFGRLSSLELSRFFDPEKLAAMKESLNKRDSTTVVFGIGASLVSPAADCLIFADMPRWEEQLRQRRNEVSNIGVSNNTLKASLQYKRSFFIDWRACDRHKTATMAEWDYLLDTTVPGDPRLVKGSALRVALEHCATRPFRVVPFFDTGPWGGQWMKEQFGLDASVPNYAWGFDCVPEENSLLLKFGDVVVEVPSLNLVLCQPCELLGEGIYKRFGAEFPIRFDLLDTIGGSNLSFQVHPLAKYAKDAFGLAYTQDESYYILAAKPGAAVFLGRKKGEQLDAMIDNLNEAQRGDHDFDADRFVGQFPARQHDHFLIPAGTLHCSGTDNVVLEISATPYFFTFKLWDWGRMGLDGLPRPINIERGRPNICWERDEEFAARELVNAISEVNRGDGWREEKTGLHATEFIETRRHWFRGTVEHDTGGIALGGVNVLNLVQGDEAIVESPTHQFAPFIVHYAETFIVPAAVGRYMIRPHGSAIGHECATIKAFIRSDSVQDNL